MSSQLSTPQHKIEVLGGKDLLFNCIAYSMGYTDRWIDIAFPRQRGSETAMATLCKFIYHSIPPRALTNLALRCSVLLHRMPNNWIWNRYLWVRFGRGGSQSSAVSLRPFNLHRCQLAFQRCTGPSDYQWSTARSYCEVQDGQPGDLATSPIRTRGRNVWQDIRTFQEARLIPRIGFYIHAICWSSQSPPTAYRVACGPVSKSSAIRTYYPPTTYHNPQRCPAGCGCGSQSPSY